MDSIIRPIENALAPFFKQLPPLPFNAKRALVKYWPIIALVLGVMQLVAALSLWRVGHAANDVVNQLTIAAGGMAVAPQLGLFFYLGLVTLLVDGALLLSAYTPLKARRKRGWDLLFMASLVNVLYGLLLMFDPYYGGFMNFLSPLVGSAIAWYFMFQIREMYLGAQASGSTTKSQK